MSLNVGENRSKFVSVRNASDEGVGDDIPEAINEGGDSYVG